MLISIVIMAHRKRSINAKYLYEKLLAMPFSSVNITYDTKNNEWDTGKRSWLSHSNSDWSIVIQDDAIIGENFYKNVYNAISNVPSKSIISFYVGTTRPYPRQVDLAVDICDCANLSWIRYNTVLWGVCLAMPTDIINGVIDSVDKIRLNYDNRIGQFFKSNHLPVYYTQPSLVDHCDELVSLTNHQIKDKRIAHNYVGDTLVNFNDAFVDLFSSRYSEYK